MEKEFEFELELPELSIDKPDVLQWAIEKYGDEKQIDVAIEEMAELIKALLKHRRASYNPEAKDCAILQDNIAEEMADVYIMLAQLIMIFRNSNQVQRYIQAKIDRLEKRLKEGLKNERNFIQRQAEG